MIKGTSTAIKEFATALSSVTGHALAERDAAVDLAQWAESEGLVPLFEHHRQGLAFRWPASERKVGAVFAIWPIDGQASFELRWLLHEPAFRGQHAGDDLVESLQRLPVVWIRPPADKGFPGFPLSELVQPGNQEAVREAIRWIVAHLDGLTPEPRHSLLIEAPSSPQPNMTHSHEGRSREIIQGIERFLAKYELSFTRRPDGSFDVPRSYEPKFGRGLVVNLAPRLRLLSESVLEIVVTPDRLTPEARWPAMIYACNEWNGLERWPKVFLREHVPEGGDRRSGLVLGESSIDLRSGIQPDFLADWIYDMVGANFDFWQWMTEEKGL